MSPIVALWDVHREAGWPVFSSPDEGQLMTLDTVIGGCTTYFLDSPDGLDAQRLTLVEDCVADLGELLPDIPEEASAYFERLRTMAGLLLDAHQRS